MPDFLTPGLFSTIVPNDACSAQITAVGARGGNYSGIVNSSGGLGAQIQGTFAVTPGETLNILVGEAGTDNTEASAGGGGGSFVWRDALSLATLLVAAGGGGGAAGGNLSIPATQGGDASITTNAGNGQDGTTLDNGFGGSGGTFIAPNTFIGGLGGGGTGFTGNNGMIGGGGGGGGSSNDGAGGGGASIIGIGGTGGRSQNLESFGGIGGTDVFSGGAGGGGGSGPQGDGVPGGLGGGGGSGGDGGTGDDDTGGGGGGGFTGGGGGGGGGSGIGTTTGGAGGGGGSFNADPAGLNTSGVGVGNGSVIINFISCTGCTIACPANITVTVSPDETGTFVTFPPPTTTGDCGVVTCTPPSGSFFEIGTTAVICSSNLTSVPPCTFIITVEQGIPEPSIPSNDTLNVVRATRVYDWIITNETYSFNFNFPQLTELVDRTDKPS